MERVAGLLEKRKKMLNDSDARVVLLPAYLKEGKEQKEMLKITIIAESHPGLLGQVTLNNTRPILPTHAIYLCFGLYRPKNKCLNFTIIAGSHPHLLGQVNTHS